MMGLLFFLFVAGLQSLATNQAGGGFAMPLAEPLSEPDKVANRAQPSEPDPATPPVAFLSPESATAGTAPSVSFLAPSTSARQPAPDVAFLAPQPAESAAGSAGVSFLGSNQTETADTAPQVAFLAPPDAGDATSAPVFLAPGATAPTPVAEPQIPSGRFLTATEVKPIMSATRNNWILVREFNGRDLLYITHIWSWRCGMLQMELGVNGAPLEIWPLPPCYENEAAPAAIKDRDGLPYREYALGSVQLIDIRITYDDLSVEQVRFNRAGLPLP